MRLGSGLVTLVSHITPDSSEVDSVLLFPRSVTSQGEGWEERLAALAGLMLISGRINSPSGPGRSSDLSHWENMPVREGLGVRVMACPCTPQSGLPSQPCYRQMYLLRC